MTNDRLRLLDLLFMRFVFGFFIFLFTSPFLFSALGLGGDFEISHAVVWISVMFLAIDSFLIVGFWANEVKIFIARSRIPE